VLFDRGERFADSGSEFTGNLTQGIQDVFFSCCLRLLLIEDLSSAAVLCPYPNTYWLPRRATEPSRTAALAVRSQISRASSAVSRASAGWPIRPSARCTR